MFATQLAYSVECPTGDLYTHKLDAYAIEIASDVVDFNIQVSNGTVEFPRIKAWSDILDACQAERTAQIFVQWQESWVRLGNLGLEIQQASWPKRYKLKRKIREQERTVALEYASMLKSLELETGIAVLWPLKHPLRKGMVSSARGNGRVYRYIEVQYNVQ